MADDLTVRVLALETKMEEISTSLNQRFSDVDAAFLEQRQFTEFVYERLDEKITRLDEKVDAGFARLARKMEAGFTRLERRLDQMLDLVTPPPPEPQ